MSNELKERFENSIVHVDIKTGRGFCRLREHWSKEMVTTSGFIEYKPRAISPVDHAQASNDSTLVSMLPHGRNTKKGNWTAKERAYVEQLFVQGLSDEEIAKRLNRTALGVKKIRSAMIRKAAMNGRRIPKAVRCSG